MKTKEELLQLHQDTVANFNSMRQEGLIDDAQLKQLTNNADQELQQYLENFMEEGMPNQQYAAEVDGLVEAEVLKSRFGAAILELGYEAGLDSVDELVEGLAEEFGNNPEEIEAVLTGDALPDEDFVMAVIELFQLDESDIEDLAEAAAEAWDDYSFVMEEAEGQSDESNMAQYSAPTFAPAPAQNQSQSRIDQLENEIAQFQSREELKDMLDERVNKVADLVREGHIPPVVANALIGNFEMNGNDRIAAFSQVAADNNVSLEAELHATDKLIDVFTKLRLGDQGMFDRFVEDEVAEFEQNENKQYEDLANAALSAFNEQHGYRR